MAHARTKAAYTFKEGPVLGVDIGDTTTCAAIWEPVSGQVDTVTNAKGARLTTSAIYLLPAKRGDDASEEFLVGEDAQSREMRQPGGLVMHIKNFLGLTPDEVSSASVEAHPSVVCDGDTLQVQTTGGRAVPVSALTTALIQDYLQRAEVMRGRPIGQVLLTAPVHYTAAQREALLAAALRAGASVVGVIAEPIAAVVGAKMDKLDGLALVLDVGGTSTTATVLQLGPCLCILSVAGDATVGGDIVDEKLLEQLASAYEQAAGKPIPQRVLKRLRPQLQLVKHQGSGECEIELPDDEIEYTLTPDVLAQQAVQLLAAVRAAIAEAVANAGKREEDITHLLLTGGSSSLECVKAEARKVLPSAAVPTTPPPSELAAQGAALIGSLRIRQQSPGPFDFLTFAPEGTGLLQTVQTERGRLVHSVGLVLADGAVCLVFQQGDDVPCSRTLRFAASSEECSLRVVERTDRSDTVVGAVRVASQTPPSPSITVQIRVSSQGTIELRVCDGSEVPRLAQLRPIDDKPSTTEPSHTHPQQDTQRERSGEGEGALQDNTLSTAQNESGMVDIGMRLDQFRDKVAALEWFLRAEKITLSPTESSAVARGIKNASDFLSSAPPAVPNDLNQAMADFERTCQIPVQGDGLPNLPLLGLAYGTWQFAVAPEEDDATMLQDALDAGMPASYQFGRGTVLHEVARHGAKQCYAVLLEAVGKRGMAGLLEIRNRRGITPFEVAALSRQEELLAMMQSVVDEYLAK